MHYHIVFSTNKCVLSITPEIQTRRYETSDTFWDNTLLGRPQETESAATLWLVCFRHPCSTGLRPWLSAPAPTGA